VAITSKSLDPFLNYLTEARRIYIAFSGGMDSHVLLHLCASSAAFKKKITAVYVDHGLQKEAENWPKHCQLVAEGLGVSFMAIRVNASARRGESPEEAARNARYKALKTFIDIDALMLLAHHREDQLETVLLQLFRGSGLRGLSGMPQRIEFGKGFILRPLLETSKLDMIEYAEKHQFNWAEDPSNQSCNFDRNLIRHTILPLLKQRWPSLDKTVSRSAKHCLDAQYLLNESLSQTFNLAYNSLDKSIDLQKLKQLTSRQINWMLRHWLETQKLKPPRQKVLQAILEQLIYASEDAKPKLQHQDHFIVRYQQKLFCISALTFQRELNRVDWPTEQTELQMANGFKLSRVESESGISKRLWHSAIVTVSNRQGGEKIKLPGKMNHQDLKKLYQEAHIPPWERNVRPLIFLNSQLAAVADLWIAEWAWTEGPDHCYQFKWNT
jgi:tRNA(Ile)-lysidine synthase